MSDSNLENVRADASAETSGAPSLDRRSFLRTAAKAGIVVPPAMVVLLSTTMSSPAIAGSGGNEDLDQHSKDQKKFKCFNNRWTGWRSWCVWW